MSEREIEPTEETPDPDALEEGEWVDDDFDDTFDPDAETEEPVEGEDVAGVETPGEAAPDTAAETGDGDGEEEGEALDELEAEELEMLTDDEESETLIVDEVAELRAIRRAELAMDGEGPGERARDEFLCQGCFLVLKRSQLADGRKMLCRDCAA